MKRNAESAFASGSTPQQPSTQQPDQTKPKPQPPVGISAAALVRTEIPPAVMIIRDLLPEGETLVVGGPKSGKSWLMLQFAIDVANGTKVFGKLDVNQGDVLYLSLEDNRRRLKKRLQLMLGPDGKAPQALELHTEFSRLNEGGLDFIRDWADRAKRPRLVIGDTFACLRAMRRHGGSVYDEDYASLRGLHAIANSLHIAVVLVHHTRKSKRGDANPEDDVFDDVSGTQAMTGAVDGTFLVKRQRGQSKGMLYTTGRDLPEQTLVMDFDAENCCWKWDGKRAETPATGNRKRIYDLLSGSAGLTPSQAAKALGIIDASEKKVISSTMHRMGINGELVNEAGKYRLATNPNGEGGPASQAEPGADAASASPEAAGEVRPRDDGPGLAASEGSPPSITEILVCQHCGLLGADAVDRVCPKCCEAPKRMELISVFAVESKVGDRLLRAAIARKLRSVGQLEDSLGTGETFKGLTSGEMGYLRDAVRIYVHGTIPFEAKSGKRVKGA